MLIALMLVAAIPLPADIPIDTPKLIELENYLDNHQSMDDPLNQQLAKTVQDIRRELWTECIIAARTEFEASHANPDYVATAMMQSCVLHETPFELAFERSLERDDISLIHSLS